MKKILGCILGILITSPKMAGAEPSGLVNKLMDTEVSMFHYGLDKLGSRVRTFANQRSIGGTASYDWDLNKIKIELFNYGDRCATRQACTDVAKKLTDDFVERNCITKTNSKINCDLFDGLTHEFQIRGFGKKSFYAGKSSDAAISELKNIFEIETTIGGANSVEVMCIRKYTENDTFCK